MHCAYLKSGGNLWLPFFVVFGLLHNVAAQTCTIDAFTGFQRTSTNILYGGDDGDATSAFLSAPLVVWSDTCANDGNVYVPDQNNGRVRKVKVTSSTKTITTIAGSGATSASIPLQGDGDRATSATVGLKPYSMCGDSTGVVYVVDNVSSKVRKISTDGIISHFAGVGFNTVSVANTAVSVSALGDGGPATSATFYYPSSCALDSSANVFLSATNNNKIKKIEANTNIVSLFAGVGIQSPVGYNTVRTSSVLSLPHTLFVSSSGDLYVSEWQAGRIRKISLTTEMASTVVGYTGPANTAYKGDGGPATAAGIAGSALNFAMDRAGNFFIASNTNYVRYVTGDTMIINRFAGSTSAGFVGNGGPALNAMFKTGNWVFADGDKVYVSDTGNHQVRVITCDFVLPALDSAACPALVSSSKAPSYGPTQAPTVTPSVVPTVTPTVIPSVAPSVQPSVLPTVTPTVVPSVAPSVQPSVVPTVTPTVLPSVAPSVQPSEVPTVTPTAVPSVVPSVQPSVTPTAVPSVMPSVQPSVMPTVTPTVSYSPTVEPSHSPTCSPTVVPSAAPTVVPSVTPTVVPSTIPSVEPSATPSISPSVCPSAAPTVAPSVVPSVKPTVAPSAEPSVAPSHVPSLIPSLEPTVAPTVMPSVAPTVAPSALPTVVPTLSPTVVPSVAPTCYPSIVPTVTPSVVPTMEPSVTPSVEPTVNPSVMPSVVPSVSPSVEPSLEPTVVPSVMPTVAPSASPTVVPTLSPTVVPSVAPTCSPSNVPTVAPSVVPTVEPSVTPSVEPTVNPSVMPSVVPSVSPSVGPSIEPSVVPSVMPTTAPSACPSVAPSVAPSVMPTVHPTGPSVRPTASPSIRPTLSPTASPTLPYVDIVFDVSVYLHNVTVTVLDADAQAAVAWTVGATMGYEEDFETYASRRRALLSSSSSGGSKRVTFASQQFVNSASPTSHQIHTVLNVEANTADFPDTHDDHTGAVLYTKLQSALLTAVETQVFATTVRNISAVHNIADTMYVGRVNVTMTPFTVVTPSSEDGGAGSLSTGEFAGIVIGVIVGFMLLAGAAYCCVYGGGGSKRDSENAPPAVSAVSVMDQDKKQYAKEASQVVRMEEIDVVQEV